MSGGTDFLSLGDQDAAAFRGALRHLAGAVSIITGGQGERRSGLTATSVSSLSAEPPAVIVSVNRNASAWPVLTGEGRFSINTLAADQQAVADRFAGRGGLKGAERFAGAEWTQLVTGAPILVGALLSLDCMLEEVVERHSHGILIGRVRAVRTAPEKSALLYWRGDYLSLDIPPAPIGAVA